MDRDPVETMLKLEIEIKKGFTKPIILALLQERPNYPYNLIREISTRTRGEIIIAGSNIYPILKNLQDDGLIIGDRSGSVLGSDLGKSKGPIRTIYSITDKGKSVLYQLKVFMTDFTDLIHPLIIELGDTN
jgi:DNA-binding PadR family transcriptional regulator